MTTEQLATIITLAVVAEGLKTDKAGDHYLRRLREEIKSAGFNVDEVMAAMKAVRL